MRRPKLKGVGDHLHEIIVERFNAETKAGCGCQDMIAQMNQWGPAGCEQHRDEIVDHLAGQTNQLSTGKRLLLKIPGAKAIARHVAGEMLDEAVERVTPAAAPHTAAPHCVPS